MKYCPKCQGQFEDGLDICPQCGVDLLADEPPDIPDDYKDAEWVALYSFPSGLYAQMAVEILVREDIPAYSQTLLGDGVTFAPSGSTDNYTTAGTVYVLEPDLEHALGIIDPMIEDIPLGDDDSADDSGNT